MVSCVMIAGSCWLEMPLNVLAMAVVFVSTGLSDTASCASAGLAQSAKTISIAADVDLSAKARGSIIRILYPPVVNQSYCGYRGLHRPQLRRWADALNCEPPMEQAVLP